MHVDNNKLKAQLLKTRKPEADLIEQVNTRLLEIAQVDRVIEVTIRIELTEAHTDGGHQGVLAIVGGDAACAQAKRGTFQEGTGARRGSV